jgi:hypothetical protein
MTPLVVLSFSFEENNVNTQCDLVTMIGDMGFAWKRHESQLLQQQYYKRKTLSLLEFIHGSTM